MAFISQKWIEGSPKCSDTCNPLRIKAQNCVFGLFPAHFWSKKVRENFNKDHIDILVLIEIFSDIFLKTFLKKLKSSKGTKCMFLYWWRAYDKYQVWKWYLVFSIRLKCDTFYCVGICNIAFLNTSVLFENVRWMLVFEVKRFSSVTLLVSKAHC